MRLGSATPLAWLRSYLWTASSSVAGKTRAIRSHPVTTWLSLELPNRLEHSASVTPVT